MISIHKIKDEELSELLNKYESAFNQLSKEPYFINNLPDYSYYLSRLLKSIENISVSNSSKLIERINFNSSFEDELSNHGNRIEEIPSQLNIKEILLQISHKIYNRNKKADSIFTKITNWASEQISDPLLKEIFPKYSQENKLLIFCNNNDEDILNEYVVKNGFKNILVIRYKTFIKMKEAELKDYYVIGYFLEGNRDFEIYHNLSVEINIFLYEYEENLYKDCVNKYKSKLETELLSEDRYIVSGIKYEPPAPITVSLGQSLQNIINRTINWNDKEFDNNIDDPDESSNEYILYQIEYEGTTDLDYLKSTDTVFDEKNNLLKINRLKVGDKIRVYKIDFGEILLNTAMEFQTEIFREIDKHSQLWKNVLKELYHKIYKTNIEQLHYHLRNHGVKVLSSTVLNNWIYGKTKFPKSDKALKAIYEISKDISFGASVSFILKSKRIYNSTLISLGRDLKEEIKNFLAKGSIGEIMQKNNISPETLRKVIEEQMPLKKIINITTSLVRAEDIDE